MFGNRSKCPLANPLMSLLMNLLPPPLVNLLFLSLKSSLPLLSSSPSGSQSTKKHHQHHPLSRNDHICSFYLLSVHIVLLSSSDDCGGNAKPSTWPSNFSYVDVVDGFVKCDCACQEGQSTSEVFTGLFNMPFHSSTYYDNHCQWQSAPQAIHDHCLAAGLTPGGKWSVFIAQLKAAHRHHH
jgi:hypothetical protein